MFRIMVIVMLVSAPAYAQPDLIVNSDLHFTLLSGSTDLRDLRSGEPIIANGRMSNVGTSTAFGAAVNFSVNGVSIGSRTFWMLQPGHDAAFSIRWIPVASGRQEITVVADPMNIVPESNEANNATTVILNLAPFDTRIMIPEGHRDTRIIENGKANLVIAGNLEIHGKPRVDRGGSILRFTVVNNGTMKARDVEVEVRVNGEARMTRNIGTLNPHASRKVSINWKPEFSGTQTIEVVVDPAMHVPETSENDNSSMLTVTVTDSKKKNNR